MKPKCCGIGSRRFETLVRVAIGLGPLGLACLSPAETLPGRFLIETPQVTAAMREGCLPVDNVRVQFAAPVTASVAAARIEVGSMSPAGTHQVRLRLVCVDHSACLPFLATVTYPDDVDVRALRIRSDTKVATDRPLGAHSPISPDAIRSATNSATKDAEVLRAGSKAMLEFEADRIHVRLQVISLQSGTAGSHVRVSSMDRKQTYTAEVITPSLLKGELAQ